MQVRNSCNFVHFCLKRSCFPKSTMVWENSMNHADVKLIKHLLRRDAKSITPLLRRDAKSITPLLGNVQNPLHAKSWGEMYNSLNPS